MAICRNVPDDQPFHPANPREYELSASNLDEIEPVETDRELFASAVSALSLVLQSCLIIKSRNFACTSTT